MLVANRNSPPPVDFSNQPRHLARKQAKEFLSWWSAIRNRSGALSSASEVLDHMIRFYSDYNIAKDLPAALDAVRSQPERDLILRYATLRRRTIGYKPAKVSPASSNHKRINPKSLAKILKEAKAINNQVSKDVRTKVCLVCREEWIPKRVDAVVCSNRCTLKGHRERKRLLSMPCGHGTTKLKDCHDAWCSNRVADLGNRPTRIIERV